MLSYRITVAWWVYSPCHLRYPSRINTNHSALVEIMGKRKNKRVQKNIVAKYAREFNKATVQKDRKKESKKGYRKHKGEDV